MLGVYYVEGFTVLGNFLLFDPLLGHGFFYGRSQTNMCYIPPEQSRVGVELLWNDWPKLSTADPKP